MEMINIFLDFYGDDLNNETEQLDKLLETLFNLLLSKNPSNVDLLYAVLNRIFNIKNTSLVSYVNKYNLLIRSISSNNIYFIKKLLQLEKLNVNIYDPSNGDTPLIISVKENNFDAFKLLVQHPLININARNYNDDTALTIAVQKNLFNYIDIIINNKDFDPEESRLNYAFYISKGDSVKKLLEVKELDVNYIFLKKDNQENTQNKYSFNKGPKPDDFESALIKSVLDDDTNKLDLLIKHPTFDKNVSNVNKAIFLSIKENNLQIFHKLINLIDINEFTYENNKLLATVIQQKNININILQDILNDPNFDSKKNDFLNAFLLILYIRQQSLEIIEIMYKYDHDHEKMIDFTKLLPNGKSYFTAIHTVGYKNTIIPNNKEIVDFFIKNGANPNVPDNNGDYPLSHAINISSYEFVCSLLDSGKIDYSQKIEIKKDDFLHFEIKSMTYLHLAALSNDETIFKEILKRKIIDVNVTDSKEETPLFYAIKAKNCNMIKMLFEYNELDYMHCNNKGIDALKLLYGNDAKAQDRNDYLQQFLKIEQLYNDDPYSLY